MHASDDTAFLQTLVRETIERWRSGEEPDAAAVLSQYPALARHKNLAVDLIYEEFCLRRELGDTLVPSTFCERFPHYRESLSKMLEVHQVLDANPEFRPASKVPAWPRMGESFMGFQLVELLGRGSLARVFLAREEAVGGRLVVVKISRHGASEAQMLGKAVHLSIVPILSVANDDSTGWTVICMPLLGTATGTDLLREAFKSGQPPRTAQVIARVARHFKPVGVPAESVPGGELREWNTTYSDGIARFGLLLAEGLQAAHNAGVMHRDIKPSNVLLGWSGRPMLLDFNLSTDTGLRSERVGGTLAYMAPELIEALAIDRSVPARQFDPRADLFSLGAVLYELLTGRLPSQPENADSLPPDAFAPWLEARRRPVVPPRQLNPHVDAGLEKIVLSCLATSASERPASTDELVATLRSYLGWPSTTRRTLRRHRRSLLVAAGVAAACAVSGGMYIASLPPAEVRLYEQGLYQYDHGDFAAAGESFRKCLELKPEWPEARFARGQALRMAGDFGSARIEFLNLKEYDTALAYSLAGYCDLGLKNHPVASLDYGLALQAGADDYVTLTNIGFAEAKQGFYRRAIQYLDQALKLNPSCAAARCQRALAQFQVKLKENEPLKEQALTDIREACRLSPDRADFHFYAAAILSIAMRDDPQHKPAAVEHLQEALKRGYPKQAVLANKDWFGPLLPDVPSDLLAAAGPSRPSSLPASYLSPAPTVDLDDFLRK